MIREIISSSAEMTFKLGIEIGSKCMPGDIIALSGTLGAGKTVLSKGIAAGMGISDDITSPTFTIMEVYESEIPLYHFDLYRIKSESEFDQLLFEEYWNGNGVSVIEWAEKAGGLLPEQTIRVSIDYIDENNRRIIIEYPGN